MLIRLEAVKAQHPVKVLDAAEAFEVSSDVDEPDPDGTYSIITDNGEDGIQVAGTERALHDWLNRARTQLSTKTGGPPVMAVLDLSTRHLPEQICAELNGYDGVTAYGTRYGWLLRVPGNLTEHRADHPGTVPDEVWQLWEYAHRYGAAYVLLDADTDPVDALPSWDW
ncbi:hypothetical protein DMB66_47180 [Actinoplanes sp. ATCC 53533]|uniref:DUF5983 family protein n=1 Tax=Actinoplanes sp. ATCC 53533 TaxID=1288362 RepID=UPI000F781600|nr:hypothetical protein [Actinoplanes sp. ATCC 53533]RSM47982.1 hypothetical protein DMB66_47180 [Actinoplanes sp. ATCC 53533]